VPVLEWREAARADLLAIVDHISDRDLNAAQHLKDEIETRTAKLSERPKLYRRGRVPGTREMVVRPSYIVVYAEDEGRHHSARPLCCPAVASVSACST